jgi:hypothetical protein
MRLGSATVCARPRGLEARTAPPGDRSEYCEEPLSGVSSELGGEARALMLERFVDSGGGGPRRGLRSDAVERLEAERCRGSVLMTALRHGGRTPRGAQGTALA